MKSAQCLLAMVLAWHVATAASAADKYVAVELKDLKVLDGQIPKDVTTNVWRWNQSPTGGRSYVALDGPGEAYVYDIGRDPQRIMLVAQVPEGQRVAGHMSVTDGQDRLHKIKFEIGEASEGKTARESFFDVKANYYTALVVRPLPGAAWYRHQLMSAVAEVGRKDDLRGRFSRSAADFNADVFALFSGGRAVSENLQL
jgi:hypothetical protein